MTLDELRKLSDEELTVLSCQRNKRTRCLTRLAEKAMQVKRERAGRWGEYVSKPPKNPVDEFIDKGHGRFTKKFH